MQRILREIAISKEMIIHAGSINRDYVLISIPPSMSVSKAVQYLKEKSSHKLLSEYKVLRKRYWVASSGNVTDEVWLKYIKNQTPPEIDDNFEVT